VDEKLPLPAGVDVARRPDGRFVPGHPATPGGGRPKGRKNTRTIVEERMKLSATTREELLQLHNVPPEMVPEDATPLELLTILTMFRALRGDTDARRDILDRIEAKQARVEVDATVGPPRSPVGGSGVGADAAEDYYRTRDRLPEHE